MPIMTCCITAWERKRKQMSTEKSLFEGKVAVVTGGATGSGNALLKSSRNRVLPVCIILYHTMIAEFGRNNLIKFTAQI